MLNGRCRGDGEYVIGHILLENTVHAIALTVSVVTMQQHNANAVKPGSFGNEDHARILLIGPVLPYRGGIAQHTTMLHRALRMQADCLTISFSRQYPYWLFPGKSDRDESLVGYKETGVEYLIDSINPISWASALKRARQFAPHVVLFPWWHVYWAPCFAWLCARLKKPGTEIVFLCHNVTEHDDAYWKRRVSTFVLSFADRFVVHTRSDQEDLLQRFPHRPVQVHPLPIFDHFPQPTYALPRRAKLELLFFGFVRPYKGLDVLLEAMTLLRGKDLHLSIVGEFWNGEDETIRYVNEHELVDNVEIVARYVSDVEAAAYFARCDVVVLPYYSATGSAVVPLAYHYGKPVIATRVGGLPDVVKEGASGKLIAPASSTQLAHAINDALFGLLQYSLGEINKLKANMTWTGLADKVKGPGLRKEFGLDAPCETLRRSHAILDIASRENKAKKIAALAARSGTPRFRKVLEVGTGSGVIAAYFSRFADTDVYAVDVTDQRQITEGFSFCRVKGTWLPFHDEAFDFIISNHVVEHVGGRVDQLNHLSEIFRCLQPGGTLYFAVPNRWRLIEPHYRLPLLSWLPHTIASAYIRWFRTGSHYDCKPLSRTEAVELLSRSGFRCCEVTMEAIRLMGDIEGRWFTKHIVRLPQAFWRICFPIIPTLIFICRKP